MTIADPTCGKGRNAGITLFTGSLIFPFQMVRAAGSPRALTEGLVERAVGPGQWSRKCAAISDTLRGRPFHITGFTEFRTAATGRLWPVRQEHPAGLAP